MASITLVSTGFTVIPEGWRVFEITDVQYKEAFGKMEIKMRTAGGQVHQERFSFIKADKSTNEGALRAFSFFAKTAMNNFDLTEIEHTDLIGKFIACEVAHDVQPNQNKPGQTITFIRLGDKKPASGFGDAMPVTEAPAQEAPAEPAPKPAGNSLDNLRSLLGK